MAYLEEGMAEAPCEVRADAEFSDELAKRRDHAEKEMAAADRIIADAKQRREMYHAVSRACAAGLEQLSAKKSMPDELRKAML